MINNNSISFSPRLFADDTCLILQDKSLCQLSKKITTGVESLNKWMMANKVTLNLSNINMYLYVKCDLSICQI